MLTTKATQEFEVVAELLSTAELIELDKRVVDGRIDGGIYINQDCGCFYGSIGLIQGALREGGSFDEGDAFRNKFLAGVEENFYDTLGITPMEYKVADLSPGDTPDTKESSAWLHKLLSAEIARRKREVK